jgi:hypothetical protein
MIGTILLYLYGAYAVVIVGGAAHFMYTEYTPPKKIPEEIEMTVTYSNHNRPVQSEDEASSISHTKESL